MRLHLLTIVLVSSTTLFGQSKKELLAENARLKQEIIELQKPKVIEVDLTDNNQKASYGLGMLVAANILTQAGDSLDIDVLTVGLKESFEEKPLRLDQQEAMMIVQQYMQDAMEKKTAKAKEESLTFLEKNKTNEGVVVTASGLQYKVLTAGTGKQATANDNVTVHYTGKLIDGTVFDSSVERGTPAVFGVTQVIAGWTEALQLMKEGDKWELYIPQELAYGDRGAGGQIPPYAALIFEVELIKIN